MESFNQMKFKQAIGRPVHFVQDNQSFSKYGVVRALHYQLGEYAQAKLVRVLNGEVLDVAVDLRKNSTTFGQYISVILSGENRKQLFIPRGFAHGFITLSETVDFFYKCDNYYHKEAEGGIRYDDASLGIDWRLAADKIIASDKDLALPNLENAVL